MLLGRPPGEARWNTWGRVKSARTRQEMWPSAVQEGCGPHLHGVPAPAEPLDVHCA